MRDAEEGVGDEVAPAMRTGGGWCGCLDAVVVGGWWHRSVTRRDVVADAVLHAVLPQVAELTLGVKSPLLLILPGVTAVAVD
jgi:hypothetical protein